jgi:RNA polymerase sigma-70 factor (ECF subfamily)
MRSGRTRRETYIGTAVPDVIETDSADGRSMFEDPETTSLLADSVGLAMLVVLETLSPSERLAMVLHDIFGVPFDVIAPMIGRTPAATRQLASRARRRARGVAGSAEPDLGKQRRLVEAFLAATRAGDFEGLLQILDPGAVFHTVTGHPGAGQALIEGAHAVANQAIHAGSGFAPHCRLAIIDGRVGMLTQPEDTIIGVSSFTFTDNRIASIELTIDPDVIAAVNAKV